MSDEETIGQRIRRCRRSRGLSLDEAAGLAGMSKPYLSRIERGERSVDSRALLLRIAAALEVSVADLTGQPYIPRDRRHADAQRGVAALRLALLDPDGPPPQERAVIEAVEQLPAVLARCDLVEQSRILPERMVRAAAEAQDPAALGMAAYTHAHALAPAGAVRRAVAVATNGVAASHGQGDECLASRGSCLLVAATSTAALGDYDTARAQVEDAGQLAARIEGPTVIAGHTSFSDWNVGMHRVAVEVEAGNPATALEAARPLLGARLAQRERVSYFWVDVGRAYSQLDRHREALDAFRRAERAAPLRVRLSPVVRDSVRDLMDRAYRRAAGVELRGLAERCGVLSES